MRSTGPLIRHPSRSASLPLPEQVHGQFRGAPAYSFGKPRHRKGKFKMPILEPRDPECVPHTCAPPPGTYEIHSTISRHDTRYGHPTIGRRGVAYSFGAKNSEPRDRKVIPPAHGPRYTDLHHVRSDSCLETPGPGAYLGQDTGKTQTLPSMPSWTMRKKDVRKEGDLRFSAEFPGPGSHETRHKQDTLGVRKPSWTVGRELRSDKAISDVTSTPANVGPGRYEHMKCMVTQFSG
eukprot:gnl/TRDRNA2_/TRDRNA2_180272_c0_seq1.p1 gnl/TRDRNA2_/TRDRNA2_180272_c0~~gnl/TRDRNA2_/TRDRNA2_180272_c0_seq1.p1  ORF type:complete len:246 (+),score=17.37 gnl/TRDRNA2_/TRDRNA2_180272_c0_seq1:35-739(+)